MNRIKKYIHILIPFILLCAYGLFLKAIDIEYFIAPDDDLEFYLIMTVLAVTPLICLLIELPGLIKSVKAFKHLDEDAPYSVKRRGIGYVLFHVSAMVITVLWFVCMLYLSVQFFYARG